MKISEVLSLVSINNFRELDRQKQEMQAKLMERGDELMEERRVKIKKANGR